MKIRISVDVEKFKKNKRFYNEKHCWNIKASWEKYYEGFATRLERSRIQRNKINCQNQMDIALDNIFKIDQVLENLKYEDNI